MKGEADTGTVLKTKKSAALFSFGCSVAIAMIRVSVGVLSGSLSILAEAADSLIDLVSDTITFFAVRIADVPPDANHPYGHARAENLGALAQAVLMVAAYGWVLAQACKQIVRSSDPPHLSPWVFVVIIVALFINAGRVHYLSRAAHQLRSQTLAASVTNFRSDMLRSLLVIVALSVMALSPWLPFPSWFILRLDAIVAAVVSVLAIRAAWGIGYQAMYVLMDGIPGDLNTFLSRRISQVPRVVSDHIQVRTRFVGEQPFVDVQVGMARGHSLEEAYELAHDVENVVQRSLGAASVIVSVAPIRTMAESYNTAVYSVAQRLGLRVHNLNIYEIGGDVRVEMDLELPEHMSLAEAHVHSERLEDAVVSELPCKTRVAVHLEPRHDHIHAATRDAPVQEQVVEHLNSLPCASSLVGVETLRTDAGVIVTIRRQFPGVMLLTDVHIAMAQMEREIRRVMPDLVRVQIDPEPEGD